MRELKFRAWVNDHWVDWIPTCKTLGAYNASVIDTDGYTFEEDNPFIVEQYTGLKDKNGKEIYENCELDGRYRVEYIAPKFVGKDMIKGDIIELYDNKFTITEEHCEISQNSKRGIN